MALSYTEIEAVTDDVFFLNDGKAQDNYYKTSFISTYFLKKKKGIYRKYDSGKKIKIPILYNRQKGGSYGRGNPLDSDARELVNTAEYTPKHLYANATVYNLDVLQNDGDKGHVDLIKTNTEAAMETLGLEIAEQTFNGHVGPTSTDFDGWLAICSESADIAFAGFAENDLVSADGTKVWEGKTTTTAAPIDLNILRTMRTNAKLWDGPDGKPDLVVMTEDLLNQVDDILQLQQRFTAGKKTAEAGFEGIYFNGMDLFADDFCPSGYAIAINSKYYGFGVHSSMNFKREKWEKIQGSAMDKTMKIYFSGSPVVSIRKAHQAHSNLS